MITSRIIFKRTYQVILPALAVVVAYALLCGRPASLQLSEIQSQLKPAHTHSDKAANSLSVDQQLTQAAALEKQLLGEIANLQSHAQQLASQTRQSSPQPVNRLAETLHCLSSHGLKCLQSELVTEANADLHPTADSPAQSTAIRLRLSGSFEQMRQALHEMQVAPTCVAIQSLSMEPCVSIEEPTHQWTLIILV